MRVQFKDVPIVGCELEKDERTPGQEKLAVRVDLGNGISTRFALDTPGVDKLGVGLQLTGEVELSSSGITPWNIPAEEGSNLPARQGHTLKGVIIKSISDGETTEEIKPKIEPKDWATMEPTRKRTAATPRAQGPKQDLKTGGEQAEHVSDVIE